MVQEKNLAQRREYFRQIKAQVVKCRSVSWILNALLLKSRIEITRQPLQILQAFDLDCGWTWWVRQKPHHHCRIIQCISYNMKHYRSGIL
uniref:Glycosyltransferase, CAZy family GT8 n=1 Tax=Arundo donax TaxID=35708 RepID=A0A0A9G180_ARUDO